MHASQPVADCVWVPIRQRRRTSGWIRARRRQAGKPASWRFWSFDKCRPRPGEAKSRSASRIAILEATRRYAGRLGARQSSAPEWCRGRRRWRRRARSPARAALFDPHRFESYRWARPEFTVERNGLFRGEADRLAAADRRVRAPCGSRLGMRVRRLCPPDRTRARSCTGPTRWLRCRRRA